MILTFLLCHVLLVVASMSFMIPYERMVFHLTRLDQTLFPTKSIYGLVGWQNCPVSRL